jgi:hypothetical protein
MSAAAVIKEPAIAAPFRSVLHARKPSCKPVPPALFDTADPPDTSLAPLSPAAAELPFDYVALLAAQEGCPDMISMQDSPTLHILSRLVGNVQLLRDVSTGSFRPLIPVAFKTAII